MKMLVLIVAALAIIWFAAAWDTTYITFLGGVE